MVQMDEWYKTCHLAIYSTVHFKNIPIPLYWIGWNFFPLHHVLKIMLVLQKGLSDKEFMVFIRVQVISSIAWPAGWLLWACCGLWGFLPLLLVGFSTYAWNYGTYIITYICNISSLGLLGEVNRRTTHLWFLVFSHRVFEGGKWLKDCQKVKTISICRETVIDTHLRKTVPSILH